MNTTEQDQTNYSEQAWEVWEQYNGNPLVIQAVIARLLQTIDELKEGSK